MKRTNTNHLRILREELFKMFSRGSNVELNEGSRCGCILSGADDHDVCIASKEVNVGGEEGVAHLHAHELRVGLGTAEFELFNDVRDSFEAMAVIQLWPIQLI